MSDVHDQADVWYHGRGDGTGPRPIDVESPDGAPIGTLRHVVRHSPTGLTWGYGGSGPADTARSLLIAALGEDARCARCAGTGKVAYDPGDETGLDPQPYEPGRSADSYADQGLEVSACWDPDCDSGYKFVPYQEFKRDHVARWGSEWRMSREQILEWLAERDQGRASHPAAEWSRPAGGLRSGPRL